MQLTAFCSPVHAGRCTNSSCVGDFSQTITLRQVPTGKIALVSVGIAQADRDFAPDLICRHGNSDRTVVAVRAEAVETGHKLDGESRRVPLRTPWIRPGRPWDRYTSASGLHGPSLDHTVVYTAVADKRIRSIRGT